ncbi:MAG: nitroreductase [Verrucomicrobiae bacterium]|nr:nitroreductase [Verrucomicrobiae bacterium]
MTAGPAPAHQADLICRLCTIQLETLCYQRAWWFRPFREVLATGVRLFALVSRIEPQKYMTRSPGCHHCLRFQKNALKEQSAIFRWFDSFLNPLFNHLRDSLLTPEELDQARRLAAEAENVRDAGAGGPKSLA